MLIDNLGSFYLSMKSVGKGFLTAEEVNANSCRLKVMFRPCTTRNSDRTVATRSLITGATFTRIDSLLPGSGSAGGGSASDGSGGSSSGTETPGGGSDADIE